jgi:hypothetical protein
MRSCPDCGADLVAHLPSAESAPRRREEMRQVLLCTVPGEVHARLVQEALAEQNIPARTQGRGLQHDLGTPSVGGDEPIQIFVLRRDLARARSVFEDFERIGLQQVDWELPPDESPDPDW